MPDQGTLQAVAERLTLALRPLRLAVADLASFRLLMLRLGFVPQSVPPAFAALASAVAQAESDVQAMVSSPSPAAVQKVLDKVSSIYDAISQLQQPPAGVDPSLWAAEVPERLFEFLLIEYMRSYSSRLYAVLQALDVIRVDPGETGGARPEHSVQRLRPEQVPKIVSDPGGMPNWIYAWGTNDFDFPRLLDNLADLARAFRLPIYIADTEDDLATAYAQAAGSQATGQWKLVIPIAFLEVAGTAVELGIQVLELPADGSKPPGLILQPEIPDQLGVEIPFATDATLTVRAGTDLADSMGIVVRPGEISVSYPFQPGKPLPSAGFGASIDYAPAAPKTMIGQPAGSRLELAGGSAGFSVDTVGGALDFKFEAELRELAVVASASDQDGFLGKILGGTDTRVPIPFDIAWSNSRGLEFGGSAGFETTVSPQLEIGPIRLEEVHLAVRGQASSGTEPARLRTAIGVAIAGKLGPIAFAVQEVGVLFDVEFKEGNAGPFGIDVGFKPPTGVGLAVDAAIVKGGGFLSFEPDKGEYAGVLELSIKDTVQVKAIGLLSTRLPGGQQGFSLLLIITAQFPPIQFSFGFVLTGVGGLIGVNRTMVIEVLRAGIRTRTLDSIMFPENPVQNAPKIISDLKAVFPPAERRFVFGPMVEIGWGTPTLVFGRLGVLLELPEPIRLAILGQLKLALPTPDEAIVEINLDALGIIEFERSSLSIDASLYDSRVAVFELSGDMALRLVWAPQPNFALSVGGLNPRFKPPPAFPELRRLTLALGESENPRLTLEAYMALTSNSVQFGAHLELHAEGGGFVLHGYLGFDALFILSPFSFATDMAAGIELSRGGAVLMSIHLEFTLEGPRPWHAFGKASFKILFFTISVGFDVRFGDETQVTLPSADAKGPLLAALADARNWSAALPGEAERGATRGPGAVPKGAVLAHPFGRLGVRQTVVPLNIEISRFGAAVPAGARHFSISEAKLNQATVAREGLKEYFARGPFFELPAEAQVAGDSFELMDAGVGLGEATSVKRGHQAKLDLDYQTQLVENVVKPSVRLPGRRYEPDGEVFAALVQQGAAAISPVQTSGDGKFVEPGSESKVHTFDARHVIASKDDLALREDLTPKGGTGRTAAEQVLKDYLDGHPEEGEDLQVVPVQEAVPA